MEARSGLSDCRCACSGWPIKSSAGLHRGLSAINTTTTKRCRSTKRHSHILLYMKLNVMCAVRLPVSAQDGGCARWGAGKPHPAHSMLDVMLLLLSAVLRSTMGGAVGEKVVIAQSNQSCASSCQGHEHVVCGEYT